MPRVQIHCYGCDATVPVATDRSAEDLSRAGWSLARGETYCQKCAPAAAPAPAQPSGAGDDAEASSAGEVAAISPDGEVATTSRSGQAPSISSDGELAATFPSGEAPSISSDREAAAIAASAEIAKQSLPSGLASSTLARIPRPRLPGGYERGAERHLPRLRPVAAVVVTTLQLPFRRPRAPVTSHSKVSSQTIVLFCLAAVLTLATLGSNAFALRLPGVIFSFAAGLSWLHDLRSGA
jgi:hypothetical protein